VLGVRRVLGARRRRGSAADGGGEEAGDNVDEAGGTAVGLHVRDGIVRDVVAGAAQAGADDAPSVRHSVCGRPSSRASISPRWGLGIFDRILEA
jgi:hypothetical protein